MFTLITDKFVYIVCFLFDLPVYGFISHPVNLFHCSVLPSLITLRPWYLADTVLFALTIWPLNPELLLPCHAGKDFALSLSCVCYAGFVCLSPPPGPPPLREPQDTGSGLTTDGAMV